MATKRQHGVVATMGSHSMTWVIYDVVTTISLTGTLKHTSSRQSTTQPTPFHCCILLLELDGKPTYSGKVEMQELQDNEAMKCEGEIVGSWSQEAQRELTHRKPVLETRRPTLREWQAVQMTWRMCRAMRKLASLMDSSHAQQRKVLSSS
ncbi:hypothetical protein BHE74_00017358 [Ensete ventricosum]|nr:hypothetical protein BHE74_00017358 [Ensete ventricosum]